MSKVTILVPAEAELMEIAKQAQASHLHLISNGQRSVLSPVVLPGWRVLIAPDSSKVAQAIKAAA